MADKTDTADSTDRFLEVLSQLAQEYLAVHYVLKNSGTDRWAAMVAEIRDAPNIRKDASKVTDAARAGIQRGEPVSSILPILTEEIVNTVPFLRYLRDTQREQLTEGE